MHTKNTLFLNVKNYHKCKPMPMHKVTYDNITIRHPDIEKVTDYIISM